MAVAEARERLMTTAERLFAEQGIDAVSLRQINLAAGQRNVAASHYHFGSKEGLIEAIIERGMSEVNDRRLEMLAEIEAVGRGEDLHAVVEAMVCPLAEQLGEGRRGTHYVRLLAQVYADPRIRIAETFRGRHGRSVRRIEELVHRILADLPSEIVATRLALATGQMIHALADRARYASARRGGALPLALYVGTLIDSIAGALRAPVSAATREQLRENRRRHA